jgi:23S rRNA (uracil1939-C5)-methyltransferase
MALVVDIDDLGHRGMGIARHEGKVILVPLTAPGDRVEVRIARSHRSYDEGRMVRVLEPSPMRREPPCPHFGPCGGCQLQHLEIAHQHALKGRLFSQTLTRAGGVSQDALGPVLFTAEEFSYRARLELQAVGMPRPALGFKALGSSDMVPIHRCLLAAPALHPLVEAARGALKSARVGDPLRVELACDAPGPGATMTLWTLGTPARRTVEALRRAATEIPGLRGVFLNRGRGGAGACIWSDQGGVRGVVCGVPRPPHGEEMALEAWPGVFSQVNPLANRLLVATVASWLGSGPLDRVLDLYAGMGNITLPLSGLARELLAVEINPRAVENGRANARRLGIRNIRWERAPAEAGVRRLLQRGESFDLVILDPPRRGAREVLDGILSLAPRRILYISCDPATLARDLGHLGPSGGYEVLRTQPLDMFPQTFHLESITLLQRTGRA